MTRSYFCTRHCPISATKIIQGALERATRPLTGKELADITGLPLSTIQSFLTRNERKRAISVRVVPRAGSTSGKPQREFWRGRQDITGTFGKGRIMNETQARELAEGRRPMQWSGADSTVWSLDETETVAVRRGYAVVCMGRAERVDYQDGRITVAIRDGPQVRFEVDKEAIQ